MLAIAKKENHNDTKEITVYSAVGHIPTVDGEGKAHLIEHERIGVINKGDYNRNNGKIEVQQYQGQLRFELIKPEKWNGLVGKIKAGTYSDTNGLKRYTIVEKLKEKSSFWIFKSGYIYYEMRDEACGKTYVIQDICFASDMHYYYIYNGQNELIAAIYKPYRNPGEDEYHIYAKDDGIMEGLFFVIAYMDFFHYRFDSGNSMHWDNLEMYKDDAAYNISCDELLALYNENFTKEVILNE